MPTEGYQYNPKKRKVYIGGTFDIFHSGHIELLRRAKELFDAEVWVALNTDEFATRYKRKPVMTLAERRAAVEACRYVTGVVVNEGDEDSRVSILKVGPQVVVHGDDWIGKDLMKQMNLSEEFLKENGISMAYISYTKGISTTDIINRCKSL